ncbi:MAG TPA: glycosyltransferase [Rubrobacteraceae bacterium]|nr:glycosyltransferase [Rubrobacteraceae bacterium]
MIDYLIVALAVFLLWTGLVRFRRTARESYLPDAHPEKILILTAAVGGGHEAAGRALRDELERTGHTVEVADGLKAMSRGLDWLLTRFYCNQVRSTPRSLAAVFAVTSWTMGAWTIRSLVGLLFSHRLLDLVNERRPDLVISTYPLVNAALGRLRANGALKVPAVAVIADYGVHPLWVAPGLDLHLVVSGPSAQLTELAGGSASVIRMPVAPAFRSALPHDEARAALDIPQSAFVALVVGGAWGIGDLEGAARRAAEAGVYAVVVTGENSDLKERLEKSFEREENVRILGWSKDLPALMSAADCMIQNAGGMTCLEAVQMGLPIVMFDPIRGHGELNCRVMERAGVVRRARDGEDLTALLRSAATGAMWLPAPEKTSAPGIAIALEAVSGSVPRPVARRRVPQFRPALAGAAAAAFFFWSAFASSGVAVASRAFRFDVPGYDPAPGRVALAVKVDDPKTARAVEDFAQHERAPMTIFSGARGAGGLHPAPGLTFGVAEEAGSRRIPVPMRDRSEDREAAAALQRATGEYPGYFLPSPKTDLAALADAPPHTRLVMAERDTAGGPRAGVLVVDSSGLSPEVARSRLADALRQVHHKGLQCVSPDRL